MAAEFVHLHVHSQYSLLDGALKIKELASKTKALGMREVVELLRKHGYEEGYKLPRLDLACKLGDFAIKLGSYFQPKGIGSYLRTHIGKVPRFDHGKIARELGLEFRPIEQTIVETLADLERWGHIAPRAAAATAAAGATA